MLKILRSKHMRKRVFLALAVIIIPAFTFWGFSTAFRGKREAIYAGRISGRAVTVLEYKDALEAVRDLALIQLGDKFNEMSQYLNLESQAWDRLALLREANRLKIKVSDQEVVNAITTSPLFMHKGKFDEHLYKEILHSYFHITERNFEEHIRQTLAIERLYSKVVSQVTASGEEMKQEYRKANEEVSVNYIAAIPADFAKDINVSDPEIQDYFKNHTNDFIQPPAFSLEYAADDSVDKLKLIAPGAANSEDFKRRVQQAGLEVKETGNFNITDSIPGIGWSPQILTVLVKMKPGETVGPINVDKSFYLIRLKERKDSTIPELDAVKDKVKEALIKQKSNELAKEKIAQCYDKIQSAIKAGSQEIDLNTPARELNLKNNSTPPFKFGGYIEGIGTSDNFWLACVSLKEKEISSIIQIPTGFYILQLKSRTPLDEKKFEEDNKSFSILVLEQKKQAQFSAYLQGLRVNIKLL